MSVTKDLATRCHELSFDNLAPEVIDRTKYLILDFIGVAARGMTEESARVMNRVVKGLGEGGMPVPGADFSAHPAGAALAVGVAGHSIELDDVVNESSLHPAVAIIPAALSAAYLSDCTGKNLIEGVVVGYEVMSRLGIALHPTRHYARGFHPTGTCGTMGAAVASAKIMGLDRDLIIRALGIAGSQAAGSMEFLSDGTMTKRLHPGWAAQAGVLAAIMAKEGFTGPETILEGRFGFLHSYTDEAEPDKVLNGWGEPFQVLKTSIKPHACCRYMQGPIDGLLGVMAEHGLGEPDIREVEIGVLKTGFPIVVDPWEDKMNPGSVVDAQFSMPFGAAVAMLFGRAFVDEFSPENLSSEKVRTAMGKVRCVADPALEDEFPKKWKAKVTVETNDGQSLTKAIEFPKGDPENALSRSELEAKFLALTKEVYPGEKGRSVIESIDGLDQTVDLGGFFTGLSLG